MKEKLNDFPALTAMILGIAGGNGREHVNPSKYVFCTIQINSEENEWVPNSPYIHAFDSPSSDGRVGIG